MNPPSRTTFVIADKPGRLGNQLLVFANLIAVSVDRGYRIVNPAFEDYADYFVGPKQRLVISHPPWGPSSTLRLFRKLTYFVARSGAWMIKHIGIPARVARAIELGWLEFADLSAPGLLDKLEDSRFIFLQGWLFRDRQALRRNANVVREYFQLRPDLEAEVAELMSHVRTPDSFVIGVHIRRGDFKIWPREFYYSVPEYAAILARTAALFASENLRFLVTSDEDVDTAAFGDLPVQITSTKDIIDMYALAQCDLIIGPPSSFNMWASFLGDVPLNIITNPQQEIRRDDFRVIPDLADPSISYLHWGTA